MTVQAGENRGGSGVLVEYNLADGTGGYQNLMSAFVRGSCAALEQHDPWLRAAHPDRLRRQGGHSGRPALPAQPSPTAP
ncbi:DUF6357 family protein [Streptomyces anulatus]|nr:DUF6357 family protein [Streptomyces clavifer]WTF64427.1 DUF6357 family protein [Streptomyces anulatus]WUC27740.1 DUF6357 family protein [Streptomyces clavifer]